MAAEEKWYFTKEQLANTPSRKSGYDVDKELSYRQQAANFIQDMGQRLKVTQLCINTAIVYMHRFYVFHSFTQFPWNSMATASLFLAAKVEEQPRKLEHVIKVAHVCLHREAQLDIKSDQYLELAQDLVFNENVLLQTLGFDVAIDHPHTHVVRCCHLIRASKDLAQTSYFMASNSLHLTTMCVQYKPTVVACFCIHLACKWSNWEIPQSSEGKDWFWYVDKTVSLDQLERLTAEFLVIYDKCPSKLRRKICSASSHESQEPRATAIPEPNMVDSTFKLLESDAKFNSLPDGPKFDIVPHLDQKAGGTSSDKPSQSTPGQPQIVRPHGDPSTSRVEFRAYREKKERLEREKHAIMSKAPPSKHTTNMRHPSHQYHPSKAPQVGGQHSNQMNQSRRDAAFARDPNKSRESQNNPMFPPAIRTHDPTNVTSSHSSTTTTITPTTSSTSSNAVTEPIEEDKARIKPLLKEHQSGQRPPEAFNHKYQNAEHRHRREHYPPDGHHKPGDPSKFHVKPRPPHPGMDIKKEKEEDQSKRPSVQPPNINKQAPPRNPLASSNMSRSIKPRSSTRNGTSESVPILPTNHSSHSSSIIPSTTSSITTTTTSTTTTLSSSSSSHSIIPDPPDLTNPSAISHLLHQTPPQQARLTRESPYPSRSKTSMPHPLVPNRPRTSTPLSPLNSPPTPGKSSRTNRNRTNSSSSEELIPVVKKLDEIPGYENILRDSKLGSGGIKLPGRVPEMIQPIRDRRKEESSQLPPPPPPPQAHGISTHLPNTRIKDENIRIKEENVRIKEETRIKEERPITPTTEAITSPTFTLTGSSKLEIKNEPHEVPTTDALNRVSSSSSLDQSIIDVVSLPEPVEKLVSPPMSDAARLIADATPVQEDAARSKKAAKHHKSDKKKRKEKSKDKDKEKERDKDKEKKKKKHKEKDKEREKTKDIPSSSAPIKIKIPKDKLNLQPSAEQISDSGSNNNNPSGLKIKIPKDRLVNSETPTTSAPTPASTSSTTTSTPSQGGGLKIKISKDVYENFNKEPRKRTLNETNVTNSNTPISGPPPAKTPRLADSKHRSSSSSSSMYGKQNGQPAVCGYNKMAQKMAESINKGKNSTSSQP